MILTKTNRDKILISRVQTKIPHSQRSPMRETVAFWSLATLPAYMSIGSSEIHFPSTQPRLSNNMTVTTMITYDTNNKSLPLEATKQQTRVKLGLVLSPFLIQISSIQTQT
jgi:hypothetical protein